MKYNELLNFEPITEVVKFDKTNKDTNYQQVLVKTFVFSDAYRNNLIPLIIKNLDFSRRGESFGLQVVGNYGTGKSHLMSLVSLIAENEQLLELVSEEKPKEDLKSIAAKFKVLRFELGNTESLWEVVTYQITEYLNQIGVHFSFEGLGPKPYFEKIQLMMAEFEEKYPEKGFLIVIDEMLAYLKSRSTTELNSDLTVLQSLGQACDASKFKFIFGVQEMIYHSPEFQFAAEMLQKVNDRYKDIIITKDDVAFVVKNRLLKKNEHQKQKIRQYLDPFLKFFTDMHGRTQEYVELFPVHPAYFENFERIRIAKSQREILKTLSNQFSKLLDETVPTDSPGLLTYDNYWEDMQNSQDLMAIPDVRKVKEVTDTIYDKIESYFTNARAKKKGIAKRITNACAIKALQHELNKSHGTSTEHLVDDLCLTDVMASDRDFLVDIIDSAAVQIITATSGQYFDKNADNGEYYLRIEGGINFDQKIKDYAATMTDAQKDAYFFKFLEVSLPLSNETYRTGFKIWEHAIEWKSHKTYCDGYIFFGNPNEKSTTQPKQHFYMYFMPIFDNTKKKRNRQTDEVYFVMDGLSLDFRSAVALYGAAIALEGRADSSQKMMYRQKINDLNKKARTLFEQEYVQVTKVDYQGKETPLSGYPLPGLGATKEQIFSEVAAQVLEPWLEEERPDYPKFTQLTTPFTKDNHIKLIKNALSKIANPDLPNRDGEGILAGLGLWLPGKLDISNSPYAKSILKTLKEKGPGKVLNRDEILECVWAETNLWVSKDFHIEAELEFVVLATLAALGEIEIVLSSGKAINASNLQDLRSVEKEDYFAFTHVKEPRGVNEAALKTMFLGLLGRDLTKQLKNPDTYVQLVHAVNDWAQRAVTLKTRIFGGVNFNGIDIISGEKASEYDRHFAAFAGFCDKLASYTSEATIKNFQYPVDDINRIMAARQEIEKVEKQLEEIKNFEQDISYLQQCKQYLFDGDLKNEIIRSLNRLTEILISKDKKQKRQKEQYKNELRTLKEKYAGWYLDRYLKHRISESEDTKKQALLDSDNKVVCDILKEADFLSGGQYILLLEKINKLQPARPEVNKQLVLTAPYHDFNPLNYGDSEKPLTVRELKVELEDLKETWVQTLKDTLDDPIVKKNMELLDKHTVRLLEDFKSEKLSLDKDNALTIRNAIMDLHKGLEKVELSTDSLKSTFSRPLTPDDAIEAFKKYIDDITRGKERNKIRIILK